MSYKMHILGCGGTGCRAFLLYTSNPDDVKLQIMRYGLVLSNQTRMSQRDIYPRWGQRLEIGYTHTPFDGLDYGDTQWADGRLYLSLIHI